MCCCRLAVLFLILHKLGINYYLMVRKGALTRQEALRTPKGRHAGVSGGPLLLKKASQVLTNLFSVIFFFWVILMGHSGVVTVQFLESRNGPRLETSKNGAVAAETSAEVRRAGPKGFGSVPQDSQPTLFLLDSFSISQLLCLESYVSFKSLSLVQ